jgi:FkbM family methyltransferase
MERETRPTEEAIRLIDVGARAGIHERWVPYHSRIIVLAFEPDLTECAALNSRSFPYSVRFLPFALGAMEGQGATLRVCRQPGCSSLLQPNTEFCQHYPYGWAMEVVSEHSVTLRRMDSICRDFQPDVIKIDTQGTELDILRGAGTLLEATMAVELEVEFVPQYLGQSLFADVDSFMRQQGFTLRGLRRTLWRHTGQQLNPYGGQIVHGDALYLRPDNMNCPKGHAILAAYRQYDLLGHFGATSLIPRQPLLIRAASRLLAGVPNRELRRFVDRLRPANAPDWHDPNFF